MLSSSLSMAFHSFPIYFLIVSRVLLLLMSFLSPFLLLSFANWNASPSSLSYSYQNMYFIQISNTSRPLHIIFILIFCQFPDLHWYPYFPLLLIQVLSPFQSSFLFRFHFLLFYFHFFSFINIVSFSNIFSLIIILPYTALFLSCMNFFSTFFPVHLNLIPSQIFSRISVVHFFLYNKYKKSPKFPLESTCKRGTLYLIYTKIVFGPENSLKD